ncbi:MAG: SUMF1/EgtB/PvdO family nonheme iron enzyme, partial [Pseudomonadota bacterium]
YHFEDMQPQQTTPVAPALLEAKAPPPGPPVEQIKGRDEATLRLVPAGQATDGAKVAAFYLEATLVTNHQFVEFLNAANGSLSVAEGVVKRGNKPWLYLGEVRKGLEPIEFKNGRFRIKNPVLAAHPVVKVTAYGAAAYAAYFGRRLPTPEELNLASASPVDAAPSHAASTAPAGGDQMASMHTTMQSESKTATPASPEAEYFPVTHYPPNKLGIRGLNSPMGSWARAAGGGLVVVEKGGKVQAREAWQGLDWVGFRTALSLKK